MVRASGDGFAVRVGGFFGALFLVYGASLPYLPILLDARGLSAGEIGLISSAPLMLRLVLTPSIAVHADRRGDHRGMVVMLSAIALLCIGLVAIAHGFWPLLLAVVAFQVALQSIMPLIETIAMAGVKRAGHDYGRMRLAGSATFIIATFAGAWAIEWRGPQIIGWLLVLATSVTFTMALLLPRPGTETAVGTRPILEWRTLAHLGRSQPIVLFLVAAGAVQAAHAVFYGFGVLQWRASGIAGGWIGVLWSIGVVAEIALFWWSARVLQAVSAIDLLVIGAAAAVVRWTLMAFDPSLALLLPLQVLHGLTYGASHLGAMHFIKGNVPEGLAGTAQALYSTVTAGIGMGSAMIVAGYTYQNFGGLSYLAMAALGVVSLLAALKLRQLPPAERA